MKNLRAKDATYGFVRPRDHGHAEPVAVTKHGRPVVVVSATEDHERQKTLCKSSADAG
jgi:hypothetical protein